MKLSTALEWVRTVLLSIVVPIVVYDLATAHGFGEVPGLLLAALGPLLDMVVTALARRRLDEFGVVILIVIGLSVVVALVGGGPQVLLLRESAVTGLLGLVMLITIPTSRPLMFLFGRRFATGGDPERIAWWNGLWQYPAFRRMQRQVTAMWGVTFVVEATVRGVLAFRLPVATMVVINSVVPYVIIGVLVAITMVWGKRAQAAGEARRAAETTQAQGPVEEPA